MIVDRQVTQDRMNKLSAGTMQHTPSQELTVADRVEEQAAEHGERPFIYFEDRVISYSELNAQANRVAHLGRDAGLRRGDVAALMLENRPEFISTWVGLAKLGVTAVLVNTNVTGAALVHALDVSGAHHVFVGEECLENLEGVGAEALSSYAVFVHPDAGARGLDGATDLGSALPAQPDTNLDRSVRQGLVAGDDLFHIFTSGTTGLPKAARLSHMRYLGVGDGMSAIAGYGPDDVIYCVLPLYHGAAGMVVVSCALTQGAAISLQRRFSASRFWDGARRHGVTGCQYIGEICRYLLNQPPRDDDRDHGIRVMMGAGLGPDIWEEFQSRFGIEQILEGWSSTEANTSLINLDNRAGSCGRIPFKEMHNGRLVRYDVETDQHLRNASGFCEECEPGEIGEFLGMILDLPDSGAGRFEGYTSKEDTEKKILRDVFQAGDVWYRSGDLLRRDEDDYYYFVDRIGDTFRWKSENVSTQEVAEALSGFPGLQIANVFGVRVAGMEGRAGMSALVLEDLNAFDGQSFFKFVSEKLPRYAAPVFVRLVREPDVTTTFKLKKTDLQGSGYSPELVSDPLYVRDEALESYVALDGTSLEAAGYPPFVREGGADV